MTIKSWFAHLGSRNKGSVSQDSGIGSESVLHQSCSIKDKVGKFSGVFTAIYVSSAKKTWPMQQVSECFAPRSTLDVHEINWRATKERPTDRTPRDNRTGGVDMWGRSVRFPCVFLDGLSV